MGTNYYFMTKNKELARKHFAVEYDWGVTNEEYNIVDEPFLGYEIHLNKLSYGWRPLFQQHKAFKTWNELEKFYYDHESDLCVYDEYGTLWTFPEYKQHVFDHAAREPKPMKWEYGYESIDLKFHPETARMHLHTVSCKPEEAELWIPFDHIEYFETEKAAKLKYKAYDWYDRYLFEEFKYWNDPDYKIDWTEGDFS